VLAAGGRETSDADELSSISENGSSAGLGDVEALAKLHRTLYLYIYRRVQEAIEREALAK
jgi:hypothetical protein